MLLLQVIRMFTDELNAIIALTSNSVSHTEDSSESCMNYLVTACFIRTPVAE